MQSNGKWRHHLSNLVVSDIDEGRVEAKGYQLVTDWNKAPGAVHMMVEARWVFARAASGWLIESLDLVFVGPDA